MSSIKPRLPYIWIPDSSATVCYLCGSHFGVINRKHHCRSCGRIFCGSCCYQYQSLPQYLPQTPARFSDGKRHRVCTHCYSSIVYVKKSRNWILIFSYLPISLRDYGTLSCVSKKFKTASDAVLSVYKSIQYKVGYQRWTGMERRILQKHWREFVGHSRLMTQAIRGLYGIYDLSIIARHYKLSSRSSACQHLHCEVACSRHLHAYDLLELMCGFPSSHIMDTQEMESWIGTSLQTLPKDWMHLLLPFFLQSGFTPPMQRIVANNLLPIVANDICLTYKFYFITHFFVSSQHKYQGYFRSLLDRFLTMVPTEVYTDLDHSERFLFALKTPEHILPTDHFYDVRLPYDPETRIRLVQTDGIKRLNTFTAPWIVPVDTSRGLIKILVKHDDLRKDDFVMTIVHALHHAVPEMHLRSYHVLPVTTTFGVVEMVSECDSLLHINKTTTLTNYIVRNNMNQSMHVLRKHFIRSCAANAVLTYMLGVGDRNLGNILIHKHAEILHIDFSYILGHDPKNRELTEMRLTPGMLDMLGGLGAPEIDELKALSTTLFTKIKKYTFFWSTLCQSLAAMEPPIEPFYNRVEEIVSHIDSRLIPMATEEEIAMQISDVVEKNSGSRLASWVDSLHSVKSSVEDLMFNFDFGFS